MRYFNRDAVIRASKEARKRGDIFLIDSTYIVGRVAADGWIELVDNEPDEAFLRFDPNDKDKLMLRATNSKAVVRAISQSFWLSVTIPKSVAEIGYRYMIHGTWKWNPKTMTHVKANPDFDVTTDGWVHMKRSPGHKSNYTPDHADPMSCTEINEDARKCMIKEVQRVRHVLRIRAKLECIQKDEIPDLRYTKSSTGPRAKLKAVDPTNLKSVHKFLGYCTSSWDRDDMKKVLARYDQWVSANRRTLYQEFGCFEKS